MPTFGDLDALLGNVYGNMLFFESTGSASHAAFDTLVSNPFGLFGLFGLSDVGSQAAPTLADLDNDGDLDALIGYYAGQTLFFENTGSASSVAFAAAITNPFGLTNVSFYASPTLADIDGDGDLDAFIGEYDGNIMFFENTGTATSPNFVAGMSNPFGLIDVGDYSSPALADLNADGALDLVIGEYHGGAWLFLQA